jgi:hypothetical protein
MIVKDVTRYIPNEIERLLWARAAGRCEFNGCNRILFESPITKESVNISEKAHIYSFSQDGPRGWGPFITNKKKLNDISNLMLVCHDCHVTIDQDKSGERYSAELLIKWKLQHEQRVRLVTGINPSRRSHVILYWSNIGKQDSPVQEDAAFEAMFPDRYPAEDRAINLSMSWTLEDKKENYWKVEAEHLNQVFDKDIKPRILESDPCHFSLFTLAQQPLLILLGTLFTDKVPVDVYQLHREPRTWKWQSHPEGFYFKVNKPESFENEPALIISLSDRISPDRVTRIVPRNVSIWELTIGNPHNDFLRSQAQISMFRDTLRKLFVAIKEAHGQSRPLSIFPAMPVACAVELGRVRMPKADMPWVIYDQNNEAGGFIKTLTIGGENESAR